MRNIHGSGLGWRRDLADFRDHTVESTAVKKILAKSAAKSRRRRNCRRRRTARLVLADRRPGPSGLLHRHAGVGMFEYFERRAHGKYLDASRLFLYKVTRQLAGVGGDEAPACATP